MEALLVFGLLYLVFTICGYIQAHTEKKRAERKQIELSLKRAAERHEQDTQ